MPTHSRLRAIPTAVVEQLFFSAHTIALQLVAIKTLDAASFSALSIYYSYIILLSIICGAWFGTPTLAFTKKHTAIRTIEIAKKNTVTLAFLFLGYLAFSLATETEIKTHAFSYFIFATSLTALWTLRYISLRDGTYNQSILTSSINLSLIALIYLLGLKPNLTQYLLINSVFIIISLTPLFLAHIKTNKAYADDDAICNSFSQYAFSSQICVWSVTSGISLFLGYLGNLDSASLIRILMIIALPAQQVNLALSNYWLTRLKLANAEFRGAELRLFTTFAITVSGSYSVFLLMAANYISIAFSIDIKHIQSPGFWLTPIILAITSITRTIATSQSAMKAYALAYSFAPPCFFAIASATTSTNDNISSYFILSMHASLALSAILFCITLKIIPHRLPKK